MEFYQDTTCLPLPYFDRQSSDETVLTSHFHSRGSGQNPTDISGHAFLLFTSITIIYTIRTSYNYDPHPNKSLTPVCIP
jgi:hypothetical protein